jgi:hypothetical protein
MQYVIGKVAWLMQKCLDTTAAEVCFNCLDKKLINIYFSQ